MELDNAMPQTQENLERFYETLAAEYTRLFSTDPEYAYAACRTTPEGLARSMTLGLDRGATDKGGEGVKATCELLGIKYTYKAIQEYLNAQ